MAFTDPQNITVGSAVVADRVKTDETSAVYANSDGTVRIEINQSETRNGRKIRNVTLRKRKIAADPLTAVNAWTEISLSQTFNEPLTGWTEAEKLEMSTGLNAWGSASTNANLKKLLSGQS